MPNPRERCDHTNVIVTYNNRADIGGLLGDLREHAPASRTILVDNASPDGTAEYIRSAFPAVHLVRNETNIGYARAVNQGFDLAPSPYVFLLNPDIRIDGVEVFDALCTCLQQDARVAVAGPLQFKEDGGRRHLNFTWSYWTPAAFGVYLAHLLGREPGADHPIRVSFLNAGCLFVDRRAFNAVGRLNEKYFLYGEEPDLFLKLMRHGYECRLVPSVYVSHAREQSLRSMPSFERWKFKMAGVANIADAVVHGVASLVLDRMRGRRPLSGRDPSN